MTLMISGAQAIAQADRLTALLDDTGLGVLEFRAGAMPADLDTVATGAILATLTFAATAFGAAVPVGVTAVATANAIADGTAVAGTPGYWRARSGLGVDVFQGTVTITGGGGDITFNSIIWTTGATITMSSLSITVPE